MRGLDGSYLAKSGLKIRDRINLLYADVPLSFDRLAVLTRYADHMREAAFEALQEEAVLIVASQVFHSE